MKATLSDIEPRIKVKREKTFGILGYDVDNAYPQRVNDIVMNSGTAKACLRIYSRFIIGCGFSDLTFYKSVINRSGMTVDKLLRKTANDKAQCSGFAWHVNYNQLYEVTEVNFVKFGDVRISEDKSHAVLYTDWDKKVNKKILKDKFVNINWYNPNPEVIEMEVTAAGGWENYKGQILYWTELGIEYPLTIYDAVLEDMETEGQLKKFRFRTASQNFLASHVLITNEAATEEEGEEFADTIRDFQGSDNAGAILIVEKKNESDHFQLEKIDLQDYDGMQENTENSAKDSIVESFLIPKPLLLKGTASIGKSEEIEDGKEYYNDITYDDRLVIEETAADVFGRFTTKINETDDYSIIPIKVKKKITAEYFPYVSKNQILNSIDLPPVEERLADTKLLAEVLGVGGTQALVAVLTNPDLNDQQKVGTLVILFGVTTEQANEMLALKPETTPMR